MIKMQWYVRCNELAADAASRVRRGEIELMPPSFNADWYRFMETDVRFFLLSCICNFLTLATGVFLVNCGGVIGFLRIGSFSMGWRVKALLRWIWKGLTCIDWIVSRSADEALNIAYTRFDHHPKSEISVIQDEVFPFLFNHRLHAGCARYVVLIISVSHIHSRLAYGRVYTGMGASRFQSLFLQNSRSNSDFSFYPLSLMETGSDILFFWVLLGYAWFSNYEFGRLLGWWWFVPGS